MDSRDLIEKLKDQNTWRLLGLGVITYGVYFAYYIKRQTDKINTHLDEDTAISNGLISSIFVVSYLSAALLIPYVILPDDHPVTAISSIVDIIGSVMLLVWGFKARNRVNAVCSFNKDNKSWFHGFWTFVATPLYFNYKVNQLNEYSVERTSIAEP